jgi:hypothetical protein
MVVVAGSATRAGGDSTTCGVLTGAGEPVTMTAGDTGPVQPAARISPSTKPIRESGIFFISTRYKGLAKYSLVDTAGGWVFFKGEKNFRNAMFGGGSKNNH